MRNIKIMLLLVSSFLSVPVFAALINGTGNVTPDVIFGSGNANGSFTGVNQNDVELGLRGKLRYDLGGNPQNIFNYDGDKTYTFSPSDGVAPGDRSLFNFEWSINVDPFDNIEDELNDLDDLIYMLSIDYDPTDNVDFTSFDPINQPYADHAIGNNTTGNGGGAVAVDPTEYQTFISVNNVAQNSWNLGFFEPAGFDPQTQGKYTIELSAYWDGFLQASTSIDIVYGEVPRAVPVPSSVLVLLAGLGGFMLVRRRQSQK